MKLLTWEDGIIRLGSESVTGILQELRVDGKVKFDEQKADGASGKSKTPQGWEDSEIMLSVILLTDAESDCYDKAAQLGGLFRKPDDRANPEVLTVTNRHITARGIRQVVFSRLETAENSETDEIRATLAFTEHRPPIIRTEASQAKTPAPAGMSKDAANGQGSADKPKEDGGITGDLARE